MYKFCNVGVDEFRLYVTIGHFVNHPGWVIVKNEIRHCRTCFVASQYQKLIFNPSGASNTSLRKRSGFVDRNGDRFFHPCCNIKCDLPVLKTGFYDRWNDFQQRIRLQREAFLPFGMAMKGTGQLHKWWTHLPGAVQEKKKEPADSPYPCRQEEHQFHYLPF